MLHGVQHPSEGGQLLTSSVLRLGVDAHAVQEHGKEGEEEQGEGDADAQADGDCSDCGVSAALPGNGDLRRERFPLF